MTFSNLFGIIMLIRKFIIFSTLVFIFLMPEKALSNFYDFTFDNIDGSKILLKEYVGKPILIVNTASFCGYTYQYKELQNLFVKYKSKGLKIIGVPSRDFGNQEFDNNSKVKEFCEINFNITFDLTTITNINKKPKHPFFQWIKNEAGFLALPKWNFYKYLITKEGKFYKYFTSMTKPSSTKFINAIENIL